MALHSGKREDHLLTNPQQGRAILLPLRYGHQRHVFLLVRAVCHYSICAYHYSICGNTSLNFPNILIYIFYFDFYKPK